MRDGIASATAQRVAAYRLAFEREAAPYADPSAEGRLTRAVACAAMAQGSGEGPQPGSGMGRYLAARTAFFDRVVIDGLAQGVTQVVVTAAGYDGRALRYAKPGVRWFEVDHPDTQRDKRRRLRRLRIDARNVAFVPADFTVDDAGDRLLDAGLDPAKAGLFLCEGLAVYLDAAVVESLLASLRRVGGPGSRLAISLSLPARSPERAARRRAFQAAVAQVGEPARSVLTAVDAAGVFAASGSGPSPETHVRGPPASCLPRRPERRRLTASAPGPTASTPRSTDAHAAGVTHHGLVDMPANCDVFSGGAVKCHTLWLGSGV